MHFVIAQDVPLKKGGHTTNYYQSQGAFFTSWTADPQRAAKFETRRLAHRQARQLGQRNTYVIKAAD